MKTVILDSHTNSDRSVPEQAKFDVQELDGLINKYKSLLDWAGLTEVLSIKISALPDCEFQDENGGDWNDDEKWSQIVTDVNDKGVTIIFVHDATGDELYFEYVQNTK